MKKVNFKVLLMSLSFIFCFLLVGVDTVEAQSIKKVTGPNNPSGTNDPTYAIPQGNFVTNQVAIDKLLAEMVSLKSTMMGLGLNQGDPVFDATLVMYQYYSAIKEEIESGKSVAESIVVGLAKVRLNMSSAQLTDMKNTAIALLSN